MSVRAQQTIAQRVAALPWQRLQEELDAHGFAQTPTLLSAGECRQLAVLFERGSFRKTVAMGRHGYGQGEYRYFDRPLPPVVEELRGAFYPPLAQTADRWAERLGEEVRYPPTLKAFLARCHGAGQSKPTPLLLRYGAGDWNALHQDLYGEVAFPFQIVTVLERPGLDFTGGEFVLVEQRPRAQSRAHVCALQRGAFLIFATRQRPAAGTRGHYRAAIRHGVSTVRSGRRTTLGVIFHDAA
jgi:hypothetical protein